MIDWVNTDQFLVIGHRGVPSLKPENTLASFEHALELGAAGIELDVHRVDDELVVIHDDHVDRTTNGKGPVSQFTLQDLGELDAGEGEKIPLLAEVLSVVQDQHLVNVELKGNQTGELLAEFLKDNRNYQNQILVSSFKYDELHKFVALCPDVKTAVLSKKLDQRSIRAAKDCNAYSMNLSDRGVKPVDIATLGEMNVRVMVYTVNNFSRASELRDLNVFGLFTDAIQDLSGIQSL